MGKEKSKRTTNERRANVDAILLTQAGLAGGLKAWRKSAAAVVDAIRLDLEMNEPYAKAIIGALQDTADYLDQDPLEDNDA